MPIASYIDAVSMFRVEFGEIYLLCPCSNLDIVHICLNNGGPCHRHFVGYKKENVVNRRRQELGN